MLYLHLPFLAFTYVVLKARAFREITKTPSQENPNLFFFHVIVTKPLYAQCKVMNEEGYSRMAPLLSANRALSILQIIIIEEAPDYVPYTCNLTRRKGLLQPRFHGAILSSMATSSSER